MELNNGLLRQIRANAKDEELFAYMLNIPVEEVVFSINCNIKISNPHRIDNSPSFSFMAIQKGNYTKVIMYDFGDKRYRGDIIDLAGIVLNLNPRKPNEFITICETILNRFIPNIKSSTNTIRVKSNETKVIDIIPRDWDRQDISYWKQYGLTIDDLNKGKVCAVDTAFITNPKTDEEIRIYDFNRKDLCYAYTLGVHNGVILYKLYFPYRKHSKVKPRFITNNKFTFECIDELMYCSHLIITKSRKDVLALRKSLKGTISLPTGSLLVDADFISVNGESFHLTEREVSYLRNIAPNVYTLLDFDYAGIVSANYHRHKYNIPALFLTNGRFGSFDYGAKDYTDYVKLNQLSNAKKLIYEKASNCIK